MAFFFMIPAGAVLANVVVLLFFGKAWSAGYWFVAGLPGLGLMAVTGVIGAILGALAVLLYWPGPDD